MPTERRGRIILLNGASSSGKTSIGRALLRVLPDPWFLVPIDAINAMRSTSHTRDVNEDEVAAILVRTRRGYHRLIPGLASAGNDVIMDYPLSEAWRLDDLLDVLSGYDVTLVEIRCSPEQLNRREQARGDRPSGLASSQSAVYSYGERDIAIDTTHSTPEQCAAAIANAWETIE
jgi:chloramphenicol 3-O phosphotransferase